MVSRRISASIRSVWWVLLITVLLGGAIGFFVTRLQTPEYTSSAELFVSTTGGTSSTESYQGNQFSQQRTASYAYLITSEVLAQRVVDDLELPMSADQFASKVTATVVPRTVLLDIAVTDDQPERAADMANVLAAKFIEFAGPLETPVGQDEPRTTITIVSAAEAPSDPSSPVLSRNLVIGLLGGTLVGLLVIAYAAFFSRRVRNVDDVDRFGSVHGLGPVRLPKRNDEARHQQLINWNTNEADDFRRLRGQLEAEEPAPQLIVVSAGSRKEPVVEFGIDLAATMAESGRKTLVVGLSSEFEKRASGFDLGEGPGFAELTSQRARLGSVIRLTAQHNLYVMTAGELDVDVMISAPETGQVLDKLRNEFERIVLIVDSLEDSSAATVLAGLADTEILVISARASGKHLVHAIRELRAVRAPLFGAVLVAK